MNNQSAIINSPVGKLRVISTDDQLIAIEFLANSKKPTQIKDAISKKTKLQLQTYFKNPDHHFDLPIKLDGTNFQKKVWRELQKISVGQIRTYADIAKKLKTSPRAVGNACRSNPLPIIIPCHRIVSKNGLGGFAGKQTGRLINIKKFLLTHEKTEST